MFFNCSSSNTSLPSASSTDTQSFVSLYQCDQSLVANYIIITFTITSVVFLLPVYIFILHLGFKQWQQQSFSTMAMSHFDFFTYHMVLFEVLSIFASIFICCGRNTNNEHLMLMGLVLTAVSQTGQLCLHILTCAERHLAVVHPLTYLSLKGRRWIRARNVTISFVWLLSILMIINIFQLRSNDKYLVAIIPVAFTLFPVLVFCLSVLRVLIRSGPGEGNGGRQLIDQSKLRAFYVIVGVLVVMLLRLSWNIISGLLMLHFSESVKCGLIYFGLWASLPSSLLMPMLYLQRKGKLLCSKEKN